MLQLDGSSRYIDCLFGGEIVKYILLILIFSGPTSPDKIKYGGTFSMQKECEANAPKYGSWVCVPIEK